MRIEPPIERVPVAFAEKGVLRELLNLYLYDLAELVDADPNEHGRFEYLYLDHYWTEPGRHAFLISRGGALAGSTCLHLQVTSPASNRRIRRRRDE